jgi:hypothetical protein
MPLCPQITITPVTVTSTGMTTSNVIPNVFVNTEELDSVASSVAGKTKTYRQASPPTGTDINDGDLWFDTDDGNKLYMRVSGEWVSVQDLGINAALTASAAAEDAAAAAAAAAAAGRRRSSRRAIHCRQKKPSVQASESTNWWHVRGW